MVYYPPSKNTIRQFTKQLKILLRMYLNTRQKRGLKQIQAHLCVLHMFFAVGLSSVGISSVGIVRPHCVLLTFCVNDSLCTVSAFCFDPMFCYVMSVMNVGSSRQYRWLNYCCDEMRTQRHINSMSFSHFTLIQSQYLKNTTKTI